LTVAKIAFFLPDLQVGGAERVAVGLGRKLREAGHAVDFVVLQKVGELLNDLPEDVSVISLEARRIREAILPFARYLRSGRPDAVQVRMWPLTIVAIVARRLARSPARLVVSDHAVISDHLSVRARRLARLTMRLLYPLADARVTVSRGNARDLAKVSGLPESSFAVIHNPIRFPGRMERSAEVERLWQGAAKRILTVGRLKGDKDQAFLIRSIARLPPELGARLMIVGSGPLESDLKRLASDLGVEDRVIFAGEAADPWPYYASADLFVLGSREESFGNVLVEALFAGLPIVSTDTTGAREVLDGGRFGVLVARSDPEAFAAAIEQSLAAPRPGKSTRDRALELSGNDSVDAYFKLLLG
jgi:glycosyltransferase involved in cell wall biosynthesis